jgi:hypothetical protein
MCGCAAAYPIGVALAVPPRRSGRSRFAIVNDDAGNGNFAPFAGLTHDGRRLRDRQ